MRSQDKARAVLLFSALLLVPGCIKLKASPTDISTLVTAIFSPQTTHLNIAVGNGGKAYVSADGIVWATVTVTSDTTINLKAVTYTGSNFVAAGGDNVSKCQIFTSGDGVAWTQATVTTPCLSGPSGFYSLASGNGKVVAAGESAASSLVRVSTNNGTTWSTAAGTSGAIGRVIFDGNVFVAGQVTATNVTTYTSSDGATFTATPNIPLNGVKTNTLGDLLSPSASRIIYAGNDTSPLPPPTRSASTNNLGASAWTADSVSIFGGNNLTELPRALAYNGTRIEAVGDNCRVDFSNNVTPLSWNASALTMTGCAASTNWLGMIWDGQKFIAVSSTGKIAISPTGANTDWTISSVASQSINALTRR